MENFIRGRGEERKQNPTRNPTEQKKFTKNQFCQKYLLLSFVWTETKYFIEQRDT